jgi:hypothetical protein
VQDPVLSANLGLWDGISADRSAKFVNFSNTVSEQNASSMPMLGMSEERCRDVPAMLSEDEDSTGVPVGDVWFLFAFRFRRSGRAFGHDLHRATLTLSSDCSRSRQYRTSKRLQQQRSFCYCMYTSRCIYEQSVHDACYSVYIPSMTEISGTIILFEV